MADIFISYKSERKLAAEHFAEVLRRYGYSVWFDYSLIKGKDFAEQIERQIRASKSLVVLWCSMSIGSRWVREEVHLAHELGLLIPVKIENCEIPFGFRLADTIDLSGWDGSPRSHQLDPLLDDLEAKVGRPAMPDRQALIEYERTWWRFGAQSLKAFALGEPIEPDNGGLPSVDSGTAPGENTGGKTDANRHLDRAERDWERFQIGHTDDLDELADYIAQYETTAPLWAGKARRRLDAIKARQQRETASETALDQAVATAIEQSGVFSEEANQADANTAPVSVIVGSGPDDREVWITPGSGESFRDAEFAPEMVVVPAGRFLMGSPESEEGRDGDEGPQHEVTIPKPFAVGKYPVTFDEWDAYIAQAGSGGLLGIVGNKPRKPDENGWGRGKRPVIHVSWDDAQAYVKWLSKKTGKSYRLLSEAEWEYAARAGTTTLYAFGDSISTSQAQFSEGSVGSAGKTAEVGTFEPNTWGLHDMHGNVWEWVEDCWNASYVDKPDSLKARGEAWTTDDGKARVLRGGSWIDFPQNLRSANRSRYFRVNRNYIFGFRLARTLTP